jgi:hypothetical protein
MREANEIKITRTIDHWDIAFLVIAFEIMEAALLSPAPHTMCCLIWRSGMPKCRLRPTGYGS